MTTTLSRETLQDSVEFQLFRIQQNVKDIAKETDKEVIGFEQDKNDQWVVVSIKEVERTFHLLLHSCQSAYRGHWDFSLMGEYLEDGSLWISDIRGDANQGLGSICMEYVKEKAQQENCWGIQGNISKRDWDHIDRLRHFYEKHGFSIELDSQNHQGIVYWQAA
ncbi:GNAT family N-acetyltransferase [Aureibacillus halotolerans]|uniref:Ribosomal protein S18 acetylase RimI-like enzyme n=1 Tax=Aureibacillus halotolerans TaxID=1508390 RepID=A0A4R6UA06_9BACI|nr:GNAT family N-acetyltransferase [Aureibacillus halotolerans]TDQ42662.1 ribosomal protein S18 acetylase RimI-like enzyme [Aureibacillus halotolerans]